jgi:hypothetical protein
MALISRQPVEILVCVSESWSSCWASVSFRLQSVLKVGRCTTLELHTHNIPNAMVEWLTLLHIRDVPRSILGPGDRPS